MPYEFGVLPFIYKIMYYPNIWIAVYNSITDTDICFFLWPQCLAIFPPTRGPIFDVMWEQNSMITLLTFKILFVSDLISNNVSMMFDFLCLQKKFETFSTLRWINL